MLADIASLTRLFSWLKGVPPGIYPSSRQPKIDPFVSSRSLDSGMVFSSLTHSIAEINLFSNSFVYVRFGFALKQISNYCDGKGFKIQQNTAFSNFKWKKHNFLHERAKNAILLWTCQKMQFRLRKDFPFESLFVLLFFSNLFCNVCFAQKRRSVVVTFCLWCFYQ